MNLTELLKKDIPVGTRFVLKTDWKNLYKVLKISYDKNLSNYLRALISEDVEALLALNDDSVILTFKEDEDGLKHFAINGLLFYNLPIDIMTELDYMDVI